MKKGRKAEADFGGLSQYEIAKRLGMSRARVSQIEAQAMRKLRAALTGSPWIADLRAPKKPHV